MPTTSEACFQKKSWCLLFYENESWKECHSIHGMTLCWVYQKGWHRLWRDQRIKLDLINILSLEPDLIISWTQTNYTLLSREIYYYSYWQKDLLSRVWLNYRIMWHRCYQSPRLLQGLGSPLPGPEQRERISRTPSVTGPCQEQKIRVQNFFCSGSLFM